FKSPKNGSKPDDQKALIDELKMLIAIDNLEQKKHPNVLSLIGAVTRNMKDGQLFVVFELCEHGDLKNFLQQYKADLKALFLNDTIIESKPISSDGYLEPDKFSTSSVSVMLIRANHRQSEQDPLLNDARTLTTYDLVSFSMQIASGMDFLSSVSCIHRDLAARNCLLTANRVVKIADFGMAKSENKGYYRMRNSNVPVPFRWMSLESMETLKFTVESDVWSYGIVLYEIFSLGSHPYPGVQADFLHEYIKSGQRNPRPAHCHTDM
ncbi:hypothetical protein PMAYCL1PPCAC_21951, partial [Pristionchus mayeri]